MCEKNDQKALNIIVHMSIQHTSHIPLETRPKIVSLIVKLYELSAASACRPPNLITSDVVSIDYFFQPTPFFNLGVERKLILTRKDTSDV